MSWIYHRQSEENNGYHVRWQAGCSMWLWPSWQRMRSKPQGHGLYCVRDWNRSHLRLTGLHGWLPGMTAHTVVVTNWESTKSHLCSKLSLFMMSWQMLKVVLCMLLFKLSANGYGLGLSNMLLFIIIAQGAGKSWPFIVGGPKKKPMWYLLR